MLVITALNSKKYVGSGAIARSASVPLVIQVDNSGSGATKLKKEMGRIADWKSILKNIYSDRLTKKIINTDTSDRLHNAKQHQ